MSEGLELSQPLCFPGMHNVWVPSPVPQKPGLVVHAYNPSAQEVKAGGSEVQDSPWLHSRFQASLDSTRPCLLKKSFTNEEFFFLRSPELGSSWGTAWRCLVYLAGWLSGCQLNAGTLQPQPFSLCSCQCSLSVNHSPSPFAPANAHCPSLLRPFLLRLPFAVPLLQAFYDLSLCFPSSQEWQQRTPASVQPVGGRQSRRPLGLVLRPAAATATHAQSNQAGFLQEPHGPMILLPHATGLA